MGISQKMVYRTSLSSSFCHLVQHASHGNTIFRVSVSDPSGYFPTFGHMRHDPNLREFSNGIIQSNFGIQQSDFVVFRVFVGILSSFLLHPLICSIYEVNSILVLLAGMIKSQSWTGHPPLQQATRSSSSTTSSPQKQLPRYSNVVKSSSDYGIPNSKKSSTGNLKRLPAHQRLHSQCNDSIFHER